MHSSTHAQRCQGHGLDIQSSWIRVKARREYRVAGGLKVKALAWTVRDVGLSPPQCSSLFLASKIALSEINYLFHISFYFSHGKRKPNLLTNSVVCSSSCSCSTLHYSIGTLNKDNKWLWMFLILFSILLEGYFL